jgi:hypothetical protein
MGHFFPYRTGEICMQNVSRSTEQKVLLERYRGRFIMFSVITNIYNTKTYFNGIVHSHRKTEKVFLFN